jgi:hypothetical protein
MGFKTLTLAGLSVFSVLGAHSVQAANWIMLQGTEPAKAPTLRAFGVMAVDYQRTSGSLISAGPWQGQSLVLNQIGPNLDDSRELQASILRVGVRGRLADGLINYWISPMGGNNGISSNGNPNIKFTDVSATINLLPHARVRFGQFKQPGSEEGLQPARLRDYVNQSNVGNQIVNESFFDSDGTPTSDANQLDVPVSGFRDTGIQVFDAFRTDHWEHTYALMAGTGSGLALYNGSGSGTPDWHLYWSSERIFGGKGPFRDGLKLSGWYQEGERDLLTGPTQTSETFDRSRYGIAATFRRGRWKAVGEWIKAEGMIFNGTDGSAVPGSASVNPLPPPPPGSTASLNMLPDEEASGWYIDAGYTPFEPLDLNLRYDRLNRGTKNPVNERRFETLTLGATYRFNKNYRLLVNYQFRDVEAPGLPGDAVPNRILDDVDDVFSVRFLASF